MLRIQQWVCAGLILAAAAVNCAAQSTGTPVFQAPYRAFGRSEIGISLSDPGSGFALEGSVRGGISPTTDLGVRGGFRSFSGRNSETDVLLGVDLRVRMGTHSESFPLDISGTVGLGLESGHGFTTGRLPLGLSMGRRLRVEGSGISLVPYVQPVLTFFSATHRAATFRSASALMPG